MAGKMARSLAGRRALQTAVMRAARLVSWTDATKVVEKADLTVMQKVAKWACWWAASTAGKKAAHWVARKVGLLEHLKAGMLAHLTAGCSAGRLERNLARHWAE